MSFKLSLIALALCLAPAAIFAAADAKSADAKAPGKERYFEMRIYTANDGKLDALNARFRDHTNKLFMKHGIDLIGYWVPTDPEKSKNTLVYILAYPSKEAREAAWKAFANDPEWKAAKAASEKEGVLVKKVEITFMTPTDYSPVK